MSTISLNDITFSYPGQEPLFSSLSFSFDTSWKLGLIGRNGKGKTTLLRILSGELDAEGTIVSKVRFKRFPYKVEDESLPTIEVLERLSGYEELWKIQRELSLLNVPFDCLLRPFHSLSGGEKTKCLMALMFLDDTSFPLIDEPTNHLDKEGRELLSSYLKSKKGFIVVSHDRHFLDMTIDHVMSLNRETIDIVQGNFSSWYSSFLAKNERELNENERLKKETKRLELAKRRLGTWSDKVEKSKIGAADKGYVGHMAAKMMQRSKNVERNRERAIKERKLLLKDVETSEKLKISPLPYKAKTIIHFKDLQISYNETPLNEPLSFSIEEGKAFALLGQNGSGKSSILKLLIGEQVPYRGLYEKGSGLIVSYIPQDASFLKGKLQDFIKGNGLDETLFKAILRKLDFHRERFEEDMSSYSDGEKKKVLIAKSLSEKAHLYVWDEPLNYIDVFSRIQIENLLKGVKATIVVVEHDQAFIESIKANPIIVKRL